jgi:hypothetical protein
MMQQGERAREWMGSQQRRQSGGGGVGQTNDFILGFTNI